MPTGQPERSAKSRRAGPARPAIEHSVLAARDAVVTDDVAVTRHAVRIDGREVAYTARAGTLPLRDAASGAVRANLFFVSYSVAPEPGAPPRPILFAWNGGPGSNAALLHLTAMGPKRLAMDDVYATADPDTMASIVDNEATWLGAADLVFVDPVGTGYSRPTSAEFGAAFYDVLGDVESIADFIRDYRERFGATRAPLILSGESYGSLRAASVARGLLARGIRTDGIVFISGSPGLADVPPQLEPALLLPSLTATALYHRKLATDLAADPERTIEEARRFANGAYADALGRPDALAADERTRIRASLARFTGLPLDAIDAESLAVAMPEFATRLLAGDGRVLGRYDARLSRPRRAVEGDFDPLDDPSLTPIEFTVGGNAPAFLRYLRSELGWRSDLYYVGPFGGAWPPPAFERGDWMTIRWHWVDGPTAPLNDVLAANPNLVVLHASGRYDLTSPAGPPARQIASLPAALAARFTVRVYEGGHSFYLDRASRLAFAKDGARLIEAAAAAAAR